MTSQPRIPVRRNYCFPRRLRLTRANDFRAVFSKGRPVSVGPLVIRGLPNTLNHPRLGLSVPRRVGNAVRRNRIKRLLRESFRYLQHDLPAGYDLVIAVRRHDPLGLADYQRALAKAARTIHSRWSTTNDNPKRDNDTQQSR